MFKTFRSDEIEAPGSTHSDPFGTMDYSGGVTMGDNLPYGVISKKLYAGEVIPFIGAGACLGSRNPKTDKWGIEGEALPLGRELSVYLAEQSGFPGKKADKVRLPKVAEFYERFSGDGRQGLRKELRRAFRTCVEPCPVHKLLAHVDKPLLIITTNYDNLMEKALEKEGRAFDLLVYTTVGDSDPASAAEDSPTPLLYQGDKQPEPVRTKAAELNLNPNERTIVFKIHGGVDPLVKERDQFLITERDYLDFLHRMTRGKGIIPTDLFKPLKERSFLFLGYSLQDWNLRFVLYEIEMLRYDQQSQSRFEINSWAIQHQPTSVERKLWEARGIRLFNQDLTAFAGKVKKP